LKGSAGLERKGRPAGRPFLLEHGRDRCQALDTAAHGTGGIVAALRPPGTLLRRGTVLLIRHGAIVLTFDFAFMNAIAAFSFTMTGNIS
jgi:hypothetical protein